MPLNYGTNIMPLELQSVLPQAPRPFGELLRNWEIRAIASRIATAVYSFFQAIAQMISKSFYKFKESIINHLPEKMGITPAITALPGKKRESVTAQGKDSPSTKVPDGPRTLGVFPLPALLLGVGAANKKKYR